MADLLDVGSTDNVDDKDLSCVGLVDAVWVAVRRLRVPPARRLLLRDSVTSAVGVFVPLRSAETVELSDTDVVLLMEAVAEFVAVRSLVWELDALRT